MRVEVIIRKFFSHLISIPHLLIKERVVGHRREEDEIKIEVREEVEEDSEQMCDLHPAAYRGGYSSH